LSSRDRELKRMGNRGALDAYQTCQFASVKCLQLQIYAGATVLYFLNRPFCGTVRRLWPRCATPALL
jgi:hypothetical protein